MAMRLEKENVRIILVNILEGCEYFEPKDREAEKSLCYIAGALDMANAVMKAIEDLGGK